MSIKNLFAMFVLLLFVASTNAFADERNVKYQDVFYPDEMPVKSLIEDGVKKNYPSEYELCDELSIPNSSLTVVVYSQSETDKYYDNLHHLYISIIQQNGKSWEIKFNRDITYYIKLTAEDEPGYWEDVKSVLDYFDIAGYDAVHLNLYAIISGTGQMREFSDIFFLIQDGGLTPILELEGDGHGGRGGAAYSKLVYTYCYLADIDEDGNIDIITQKYNYERNSKQNIHIDMLSNLMDVYKFDTAETKYVKSEIITELPEDARKLGEAVK